MILVDAAIFIIVLAAIHFYKLKYPNFLFFCKGAVLFLPPDEPQNQKQIPKPVKNQDKEQKQQKGHQISVIKIQYNQVKEYPFANQFQRVTMTITALVFYYLIRFCLIRILPDISTLAFYILLVITFYAIKIGVDIYLVSSYKSKTCFMIALGINLFYLALIGLLGNIQGVYDQSSTRIASDYSKHLQILIGKQINFVNKYSIVGISLFFNFFITLATIPTIVKFGNWYSKTLKQVYYNQDEQTGYKLANSTKQSTKQAQQDLKRKSKRTISILNYYLVSVLVFQFLCHRFILTYVAQKIVDVIRAYLLVVAIILILYTMSDAIEFNGSFAYKFVLQYFKEKTEQGKLALRRKIVPYVYHIWYHFYQYIIRIVIPILIFLIILHWKYFITDTSIQSQNIDRRDFNPNIECKLNTNQLDILESLNKCPLISYRQMELKKKLQHKMLISGQMLGQNKLVSPSQLQYKLVEYGVLKKDIMVQLAQTLMWYSNMTIYGMTVVYVLFLRKTVYQI